MDKDYYKIMGLDSKATEKEIKAAYRKLARKYHPDLNKEPQAEERFKEMGEAYEVLKDPAKRAEYDNYVKQAAYNKNAHYSPGEAGRQHQYYQAGAQQFDSDFFESLFGHARQQQRPSAGQDYHGKVSISLEEAFHGTTKSIQVPQSDGTTQTLNVKIPAGVKAGQQIRLSGQGAHGINGGPRGSIYLTMDVGKHHLFDVIDSDVYLTLPITPWEAALGATVVIPTLSGKIDLKIPPGSQGGQKLRLKNRGLPGKEPGNQYVLLKITTPAASSDEAKALYQKMAQTMPFNPRAHMGV